MIDDEQVHEALRHEADRHEPDLGRLRARFEAGRSAAVLEAAGPGTGRRQHRASNPGAPARRLAPMLRPAVLVAVVVCAVTVITQPVSLAALLSRDEHRSARPAATVAPAGPTGSARGGSSGAIPTTTPDRPASTSTPTSQVGAPASVRNTPGPEHCAPDDTVVLSPYWLNNNLWAANKGKGSQCVQSLSGAGPTIAWSTNWDWSGAPDQVKSFASVVYGWQWGWKVPRTGLPVKVSDLHSLPTEWDFTVTQNAPSQLNVGYDLWFHTIPDPTNENPSAEIGIVLQQIGPELSGAAKLDTYSFGGTSWDLYLDNKNAWDVFTFVRTSSTTSVSLNLKQFIDAARAHGQPATFDYLSSVQAGANVRVGKGRLTTTRYSVRID
jgi:xyloglucan-specific endo-beta-1,4-glucanase